MCRFEVLPLVAASLPFEDDVIAAEEDRVKKLAEPHRRCLSVVVDRVHVMARRLGHVAQIRETDGEVNRAREHRSPRFRGHATPSAVLLAARLWTRLCRSSAGAWGRWGGRGCS